MKIYRREALLLFFVVGYNLIKVSFLKATLNREKGILHENIAVVLCLGNFFCLSELQKNAEIICHTK